MTLNAVTSFSAKAPWQKFLKRGTRGPRRNILEEQIPAEAPMETRHSKRKKEYEEYERKKEEARKNAEKPEGVFAVEVAKN